MKTLRQEVRNGFDLSETGGKFQDRFAVSGLAAKKPGSVRFALPGNPAPSRGIKRERKRLFRDDSQVSHENGITVKVGGFGRARQLSVATLVSGYCLFGSCNQGGTERGYGFQAGGKRYLPYD